jgi:hypothetical protein
MMGEVPHGPSSFSAHTVRFLGRSLGIVFLHSFSNNMVMQ